MMSWKPHLVKFRSPMHRGTVVRWLSHSRASFDPSTCIGSSTQKGRYGSMALQYSRAMAGVNRPWASMRMSKSSPPSTRISSTRATARLRSQGMGTVSGSPALVTGGPVLTALHPMPRARCTPALPPPPA